MSIENISTKADLAAFIDERIGTLPQLVTQIQGRLLFGTGSPENLVSAPVGVVYFRVDGGLSTTLYVKEAGGDGNTGWTAK